MEFGYLREGNVIEPMEDATLSQKLLRLDPGKRVVLNHVTLPLSDISGGYVELSGGRIASVGSGEPPTPAGDSDVIDCTGQYLLPGLIDAHVHFTGDTSKDPYRRYMTPRDTARAIRVAMDAQAILSAGFTTVRALGHANAEITYGLRDCIEAGWCYGPRVLTSGWAISQTGGHGNLRIWPYGLVEQLRPRSAFADGPADLRRMVRQNFGEGADLIKIYATEGRIDSPPKYRNKLNFSVEEMSAIAEEAHMRGARVSAHATTVEGAKRAVLAGIDTIEHGPHEPNEELVELMVEKQIFLVPTLAVARRGLAQRKERGLSDEVAATLAREAEGSLAFARSAIEAGVKIVCGTDSATRPEAGQNSAELEFLVQAGFSDRQALEAATAVAADALNISPELGRLDVGAIADCVLLQKDPTRDVRVLQDHNTIVRIIQSTIQAA